MRSRMKKIKNILKIPKKMNDEKSAILHYRSNKHQYLR
jgi:hypothetical protein